MLMAGRKLPTADFAEGADGMLLNVLSQRLTHDSRATVEVSMHKLSGHDHRCPCLISVLREISGLSSWPLFQRDEFVQGRCSWQAENCQPRISRRARMGCY